MSVFELAFFCFSTIVCAGAVQRPGVPVIDWADRNYALVSVDQSAVAYETLVQRRESITLDVSWNVWSGDAGDVAYVFLNDRQVWKGNATVKRAAVVLKAGGLYDMIVRECNSKGCSDSASVAIVVADTDGAHLSPLYYSWRENNKPYEWNINIDGDGNDGDGDDGNNDGNNDRVNLKQNKKDGIDIDGNGNDGDGDDGNDDGNNDRALSATSTLSFVANVVAAYFVEWGVYQRAFAASDVPAPNLSHMLYGFIPICGGDGINDALKTVPGSFEALQKSCAGRENFKVAIHDPWAAVQKPQKGASAWNEPYKGNFGQIMAIKKANPQLRVLPSVGGWTLSDPFYHMHDAEKRATFVESVREFLLTWKFFDGVDIDWEFPGGKGANPNQGDAKRDALTYVSLLKELRSMLDDLQKQTNRSERLLLTSAISAGDDKIAVVDYGHAQTYLDLIFLMSYDFKGAWSNTNLGHQTALYAPAWKPNERYTTDYAVNALLKQNVLPRKIVVGVAMYGRGWIGVTDFPDDDPFGGTARGPAVGTWEDGVVDYRQLVNLPDFEFLYDRVARAAYAFQHSTGTLLSYDSVQTVLDKGRYALKRKLAGLFAWEIDADNGDLLNAMHAGLGHSPKTSQRQVQQENAQRKRAAKINSEL
ncbi:chitinase [Lambdina fiscellaria nucleopolyhedrovirus]|uniref:Chitinase n=1 Tax=Lambdina fiscellaria nucleopolyhedrovirus TaxID=1642929 RepID=A0A0E3Z6S7_9ABAC|nr:chitinase [Lambdina fiscellaria nucleopolyhedrovirus]AKC91706.1 chitinase [Lambdina fiscellaria nucleopolyhedrovirus]